MGYTSRQLSRIITPPPREIIWQSTPCSRFPWPAGAADRRAAAPRQPAGPPAAGAPPRAAAAAGVARHPPRGARAQHHGPAVVRPGGRLRGNRGNPPPSRQETTRVLLPQNTCSGHPSMGRPDRSLYFVRPLLEGRTNFIEQSVKTFGRNAPVLPVGGKNRRREQSF